MDGTFIPLDGNQQNRRDLAALCSELEQRGIELIYVTGRHYELVLEAIDSHALPAPQWMICDVGTSIYQRDSPGDHQLLPAYQQNLADIVGAFGVEALAQALSENPQLILQEPEKQGPYKLSYYCEANSLPQITEHVEQLVDRIAAPYRIIASVDPFTDEGLVDFLPRGVSKDYALQWWVEHTTRQREEVIFAGDSGNDVAALIAGYRSIVVGNADAAVSDQVSRAHQSAAWSDRLFLASQPATSGVLEGLRYFLDD
jgi:HAD superfamily hydrolase (TIGR01484 family)